MQARLEAAFYPCPLTSRSERSWSRDATSNIADALTERATNTDAEIAPALKGFIEANSTSPFNLQLMLPLPNYRVA